jgi:hypothetical protein
LPGLPEQEEIRAAISRTWRRLRQRRRCLDIMLRDKFAMP